MTKRPAPKRNARGVLMPFLDKGRGVARQTLSEKSLSTGDYESSKRQGTVDKLILIA